MANLHKFQFGFFARRRVVPLFVIATFLITSLPVCLYSQVSFHGPIIREREPNNTIARAQAVPLPVVVKGTLEGIDPNFQFVAFNVAGLVDNFRVQTLLPGMIVADLSFGRGWVTGELDPDRVDAVGALPNTAFFPLTAPFFGLFGQSDPNLIQLGLGPVRTIDRSNYGFLSLPSVRFGGGDSIGRGNPFSGAILPPALPGPPLLPNLPIGFGLPAVLAANRQADLTEFLPKETRRSNAANFKPLIGTLPPGNYVLAIWDGTTDFVDFFFTGFLITFATFFAPALGGTAFLRGQPDAGNVGVSQTTFFANAEFDNIQTIRYTAEARSAYALKIGFRASTAGQPPRASFPAPIEQGNQKENTTISKLRHLNPIAAANLARAVGRPVGDAYKIQLSESQPMKFDLVFDSGWADTFQVYRKTADRKYELVASAAPAWGSEDVGMYLSTEQVYLQPGDYYVTIPSKSEDLFAVSATDGVNITPLAVGLKLHPNELPNVDRDTVAEILRRIEDAKSRGQKYILKFE